jgi:hypothetical protein
MLPRLRFKFTLTMAAYDLIRLPELLRLTRTTSTDFRDLLDAICARGHLVGLGLIDRRKAGAEAGRGCAARQTDRFTAGPLGRPDPRHGTTLSAGTRVS